MVQRLTIPFGTQLSNQRYYVQHNFQMVEYCQLISPHDPEHPDYNRGITGINRKVVDKIKAEFDPNKVNPVTVSLRDGKYYILNGQHTSVGIYELNGSDSHCLIQCEILTGLTREEEAKLFIAMNVDVQKLKIQDKIWALIISGDSHAKEFERVIKNYGYDFELKGPKQISAISACWSIFNSDGGDALAEMFAIASKAWPDDGKAISTIVMKALQIFVGHHKDEYEKDWLIKRLSETSHGEIEKKAKNDNLFSMDKHNQTKNYCAYREIVRRYNNNRTAKNRLRLWDPTIDV